jgi:PIN domain nuclease of toxin-antitoxin system
VLRDAERRGEPLAVSAITLLEIALLKGGKGSTLRIPIDKLFEAISSTGCHVIPLDVAVASEVAAMGDSLKDPADRTIVATARVHRLKLVTSDQRIIDSELVTVVE